jgi:hypothetical protein
MIVQLPHLKQKFGPSLYGGGEIVQIYRMIPAYAIGLIGREGERKRGRERGREGEREKERKIERQIKQTTNHNKRNQQ